MGIPVHSFNVLDGSSIRGDNSRLNILMQFGVSVPVTAGAVTALGAITAGTGFTSLPALVSTAGTGSGFTAVATSLKVVSAAVVAGGTSGFVNADTITLSNGVVLAVASVSGGVVLTVTVTTAGAFAGNYPALSTNPVSQVATSGAGVGTTTFTLVYGVGTAQTTNSGLYTVVPTGMTVTGGGGTGASLAAPTLGGAGNTIALAITPTEALPPNYFVMMSSNAVVDLSYANKSPTGFSIAVTPSLAATSLTVPTIVDVLVIG